MTYRGWEHVTEADLAKMGIPLPAKMTRADALSAPKKQKYGAVKTVVDGITFDSKKEATRYSELKTLEAAGKIQNLELQPRFVLRVLVADAPVTMIIGEYRGDFRYTTSGGAVIVEDVKGFKTPLYRWKKKHVQIQYGIEIKET